MTKREERFGSRMNFAAAAFAILVLLLLSPATARAQWATSGTNISNTNTGNVGVGTSSPGVMPKVGRVILTVKGISDAGVLELATGSADADGSDVGHIQFVDVNNPNTEKRVARIVTQLSGATANNRAGIMRFDLKTDGGGSIIARMHLSTNGLYISGNASTSAVNRLDVNGNAAIGSTYALTAAPTDGLIVQGYVGIGATSPAYKLDVDGQVRSRTGGFVFPDGTTQATAASPVTFGSTAGTAVQGNTTLTVAAGTGMSGGGTATLGGGGTLTLTNSDRGSSQNIFKNVGNAAGATQFSAGSNTDTLRFEGTGGTTVSFDAANRKVIINSSASSQWANGSGSSVYYNGGNVGIGTNAPNTAKLVIAGGAGSPGIDLASSDVYAEMRVIRNSVGAADKDLFLQYQAGANSKTHIYSSNAETVTISGGKVGIGNNNPGVALDVTGAINATGAITGATINATYQDVAEWVPSTQKLAAGTVVVLDTNRTNHVLASKKAYDTAVAGVVSAEPGVILGVAGDGKLKVATTGRVRVRIDATRGAIHVGDLLVTSDVEGVAMKSVEVDLGGVKIHRPGTIIGKALEPLDKGTGEILVLLSLQ